MDHGWSATGITEPRGTAARVPNTHPLRTPRLPSSAAERLPLHAVSLAPPCRLALPKQVVNLAVLRNPDYLQLYHEVVERGLFYDYWSGEERGLVLFYFPLAGLGEPGREPPAPPAPTSPSAGPGQPVTDSHLRVLALSLYSPKPRERMVTVEGYW